MLIAAEEVKFQDIGVSKKNTQNFHPIETVYLLVTEGTVFVFKNL